MGLLGALSSTEPNRSDLRWANTTIPMIGSDVNGWLANLNKQLKNIDSVIPYCGFIDLNDSLRQYYSDSILGPARILNDFLIPLGSDHVSLVAASALLDIGLSGLFSNTDGLVPLTSAKGLGIQGFSQPKGFFNYDHKDMKDGIFEGGTIPLFDEINNDLEAIYLATTTPPSVISNFQITAGINSTDLTWTNPTDPDFSRVLIVRSSSGINWTPTNGQKYSGVITADLTVIYNFYEPSTVDSGLIPGTSYFYKAFSYDNDLNYSAGVTPDQYPITVAPLPGPTETKVGNLSGSTGSSSVSLSWVPPTDSNYGNYLVVRGSWSPSNDVDYITGQNGIICKGTSTSCGDSGLLMGTEYSYTVFTYYTYQTYDDINKVWITHINYGPGNSINLITKLGGTLNSNLTLLKINNPYLVESQLTVPAGVTLTIEPGAVIKFSLSPPGCSSDRAGLQVQGGLVAEGTTAAPIIFTSWNDSSVGGATGSGTPAAGDWDRILFEAGSTGTLRHVVIKYGGIRNGPILL